MAARRAWLPRGGRRWRRVIRNSFSQFAEAFNALLRDGEEGLLAAGKGKRVLFMIDGTDKLRSEDRLRFFVHDAEQLLAIDAHVVYTAPLSLKYEGNLTNRLDADLVLPMIKLGKRDGSRCAAGTRAVTDILLKRGDRSLFASECEIERLVEHCGGHPRELLKLLKLCCEFAEGDSIDARTVEQAITQLASEYRRFLEPDDRRKAARCQFAEARALHEACGRRQRCRFSVPPPPRTGCCASRATAIARIAAGAAPAWASHAARKVAMVPLLADNPHMRSTLLSRTREASCPHHFPP